MQLGGLEIKGWSDAEVDLMLARVEEIQVEQQVQTLNQISTQSLLVVLIFFVVSFFAYIASAQFFPTSSELTGD